MSARYAVAIFATFLVAAFATTTGIALDFEMGNANQQIGQLQARVTRLEHAARPHVRLTAAVQPCPPGITCLVNVVIEDSNGLGDALNVHDYLGNPMMGVDTFQLYSSNPVCAIASSTDPRVNLAREACLGGPPFDATGGHAVLALWDGSRWQVLTARDVAWLHRAEQIRPNW